MTACQVVDCSEQAHCRGWCRLHYGRWQRTGDPTKCHVRGPKHRAAMDRLVEKIEQDGDCWRWTGSRDKGYGKLFYQGRLWQAHRVAYVLFIGGIPDGLTLDHLCRNRACVNPYHLDPVPMAVNHARGVAARTHCKHGHEFTRANTYRTQTGRHCRRCRADAAQRHRDRRRLQVAA